MNIFIKTLRKIFGDKYEKDMKSVEPFIEKIKEEYKKVVSLTNDELRDRTLKLKENILAEIKNEEAEIES
jgi:preprotein translocase subunit SecA